ncbi:DUF2167 domain-containing protein [Janthinobacterium sp. SUN026]|uniref:DUF2167 domain-containing protein n=1 Tax=Janthinobacterium sp. SUN026 TaxID=3002438 RepID=UPI0025B21E45|nr:DUF2167 domain-containing protein [Janthinobacterium sp. SUN026]MDN2674997.1 DUF2167 domain-containing protein [Janthinobacterium sp. SUN026]
MLKRLLTALLCLTLSGLTAAAPADEKASAPEMTAEQFLAQLHLQRGKITLPGGIATLDLPANFRYLSPTDAERVLVDAWGNPPGMVSLGMIVPAKTSVLERDSWGVIVTYEKEGHIKDDDADSIKYDELLKDMQASVLENNAERKKQGYPGIHLMGWAEKPSYAKDTHKLYWAKDLMVDGGEHSLNYNVRVLGREGVLNLNAIASMQQIEAIKKEMQQVTAFTEFTEGNRYTDFDSKTDKVAEYGLAALVAGGVASKLGLFGKLLALLLAFKKVLILAVVGGGAAIVRFFSGKRKDKPAPQPALQPEAAEQPGHAPDGKVNLDK